MDRSTRTASMAFGSMPAFPGSALPRLTRLGRVYDDAAGVTAAFNRNVIAVIARELDFDLDTMDLDHVAR